MRRASTVGISAALLVVWGASPAAAHGIGGRADLPVPVSFFIVGAGIALVVSFVALAALWPEPRLQDQRAGVALEARWLGPARLVLAAIGLAGLGLVVLTGIINRDGGRTVSPVLVWVYFWLVVPFLAIGVGNWWRAISPWRTMATWLNRDVPEDAERGARLGVWPAAIAFVAFTWLELVADTSAEPRTLAIAALVYSVYLLAATRYLGARTGLATAGAFENYNRVIGSMSTFDWQDADGDVRIVRRGWLRGLTGLRDAPGLIFLIVAMIGTVTYDGMSGSSWWSNQVESLRNKDWFETMALLGTIAVIGGAYWLASEVAARISGHPDGAAGLARSFAHTLVPIAFAYAFAHYFTLVLVEGQTLLHAASDPFGLGWDLFGTATWRISWVPTPEVVWYIQVGAIVAGHVAGVVLAHDRALHEFGERIAVRTQYAMLLLMVGLTSLGLVILSG